MPNSLQFVYLCRFFLGYNIIDIYLLRELACSWWHYFTDRMYSVQKQLGKHNVLIVKLV